MVWDLVRYGWITLDAMEASHTSLTANTMDGESMTAAIAKTPVWSVPILALQQFAWQMVDLTTDGLKFIIPDNGVQCVMIAGISMTQMLCVFSLDSPGQFPPLEAHDTAGDQILFGWIMSTVKVERLHYLTVLIMVGEMKTVIIMRMRALFVSLYSFAW